MKATGADTVIVGGDFAGVHFHCVLDCLPTACVSGLCQYVHCLHFACGEFACGPATITKGRASVVSVTMVEMKSFIQGSLSLWCISDVLLYSGI